MAVTNELTVIVGKDKVRARTKGGTEESGAIGLDYLRLATIKVFEELLLDNKIENRRHMEVLGQHLYAALFQGDVGQLLNEQLAEVQRDRLRLQLQFEKDVDREIASLPWEFLYSPKRQDFLATDVNLVLSRYLALDRDREQFQVGERPLTTLIAISRPIDERPVLAKEVVDAIRSLNRPNHEPIIRVELLKDTTLQGIEDALKEHQPHIFHFIGHGNYDPVTRTGYLSLINADDSTSEPCDDSTLIDRFRTAQCFPKLVFLHMCEGGFTEKDATKQAFSGFAPKLIHAKIPSVVAMRYPIKNEHASEFSKMFYSSLAAGASADEAVQKGRGKLDLRRRSRLFGTPMLYMHSATSLVLPEQRPLDPSGGGSSIDQQSIEPPDLSPKTHPTEPSAPAPAGDELARAISGGFQAARSLPEGEIRTRVRQRLVRINGQVKGKTETDIFNAVFDAWEDEIDQQAKEIWQAIMEKIENTVTRNKPVDQ